MRTEYNKYSIAETVQNFMVILTTTAYFETPLFCRCKRVRNEGNLLLYSHRDMKYKHGIPRVSGGEPKMEDDNT